MNELQDALWQFVHRHGYLAIFTLLLLEESGIPLLFLPGDLLIAWAGFQYSIGNLDPLKVILVTNAALVLGSSILYAVSWRFGRPVLQGFSRVLRISPETTERPERWVQRRGFAAVVLGRLIPGFRTLTSVVSGVLRLPYRAFLPGTLTASVIWTLFYFYTGTVVGAAWDHVDDYLYAYVETHKFGFAVLAIAFAGGLSVAGAVWLLGHRRSSRD